MRVSIIIIMDTCIVLLVHCMKMCQCCGLHFIFRVIVSSAYFSCTICLKKYTGKTMYIVNRPLLFVSIFVLPGCKQNFSGAPLHDGASCTHVDNWSLQPVLVVTVAPELCRLILCYRRNCQSLSLQSVRRFSYSRKRRPCSSVSPSICSHVSAWLPLDRFPWNLMLLTSYENPSRSCKFSYKRTEISGTLHEGTSTLCCFRPYKFAVKAFWCNT